MSSSRESPESPPKAWYEKAWGVFSGVVGGLIAGVETIIFKGLENAGKGFGLSVYVGAQAFGPIGGALGILAGVTIGILGGLAYGLFYKCLFKGELFKTIGNAFSAGYKDGLLIGIAEGIGGTIDTLYPTPPPQENTPSADSKPAVAVTAANAISAETSRIELKATASNDVRYSAESIAPKDPEPSNRSFLAKGWYGLAGLLGGALAFAATTILKILEGAALPVVAGYNKFGLLGAAGGLLIGIFCGGSLLGAGFKLGEAILTGDMFRAIAQAASVSYKEGFFIGALGSSLASTWDTLYNKPSTQEQRTLVPAISANNASSSAPRTVDKSTPHSDTQILHMFNPTASAGSIHRQITVTIVREKEANIQRTTLPSAPVAKTPASVQEVKAPQPIQPIRPAALIAEHKKMRHR